MGKNVFKKSADANLHHCRDNRIFLIMNNTLPANKPRDYIMDLETDIRNSMEKGFPFLIFTPRLEKHFLSDTLDARKKRFFILGIIAIVMYNLFLLTDREMLPDIYLMAWKIRLGIVTPVMIIILGMMRWRAFARV